MAKEAVKEATQNGSDVVLVDTAGRMQVQYYFYEFEINMFVQHFTQ